MRKGLIAGVAIAMVAVPLGGFASARVPDTFEGLFRVKAKRLDVVYLLPDADFRVYTKVMIDTPQVAFKKNWQRDYNSTSIRMGSRVDDSDIRKVIDEASARFREILIREYGNAGYQVADAPGPDVVRLSTAIINLSVVAPDMMSAGRSRTYSSEAGQATLVLEARDSVSGEILGRALDNQIAGDNAPFRRDSISNRADFEQMFDQWAKAGAKGLTALKTYSPIDANGDLRR